MKSKDKVNLLLDNFLTLEGNIRDRTNANGPGSCYMTVHPTGVNCDNKVTQLDLVIGASFHHRCASAFGKKNLKLLAKMLKKIADAMADEE